MTKLLRKKSYSLRLRTTLRTLCAFGLMAMLPSSMRASVASPNMSIEQQQTVKGHITDENGEPLIGVTVRAVEGNTATVTDMDGQYVINVARGTKLRISYAGYKEQIITAGGSFKMEPDVLGLDDVVVIGYGTQKKRDLTGAITSVKAEDVTIAPTNNVMEALQGRVSGLDITKTSGEVGSDVSILLRGSRSIYGSNSPLFIIDGLPGSYGDLSPNDIESIEVLKDASSTAIYGSAGANGVIIITTKRGAAGKVKVNFDAYYGWSGDPQYKHGMTGDEWTNYFSEAYAYKNGSYPENASALFSGDTDYIDAYNSGKWIDWVSEASDRKATTQKYSLSVTGGTAKTNVYASVVYSQDKGLLSNEQLDRYALRLNIDQEIFSWAKVGFSSNLTYSIRDRGNDNTYAASLSAFPLGDLYDQNGDLNYEYINNQYTPLGDYLEYQYANNTRNTYINAIGYLELTPLKGLKFRSQLNGTLNHKRVGTYWGANSTAKPPTYAGSPDADITHSDGYSYTWENILSYNITVAKDHDFGLTGVTSWQKEQDESAQANGWSQDLDSWQYWRLIAATGMRIESSYTQTQKMSYALRFNYSYKGRYLATFSNRWDGVSFFSEGQKWDSFPAAAIGWRISDEPFMESTSSWLDNLKLRVGWGITGNSGGVGAYSTQTNAYKYPAWGVSLDGTYVPFTQYSGTYGSPSLGWEKSYNWNVGIDFAFLNGRIDGNIDWYSTITRGLLFKRTMPITSGITGWGSPLASWENIAKTSNKGVEITINTRNIVNRRFTWSTSLTATWAKEKIVSLPSGDLISESLFEGQPIHSIYDYKYAGIWGTDATAEELETYGVKAGWVKVETNDKDGDGGAHKYSTDDRQILGHENPNWIIGLNNTFTLGDFDLSIYAMGRFGQTIYSDLIGYYTAKSSVTTNQPSGLDYWTESNQDAYFPRPGSGDDQTVGITALRVFDGSFIKIKNITLGYTLPRNITQYAKMSKVRFYFTAYNPFIFSMESQLDGTDPEMGGSDSFPTYKQYVFGVNITF